MPILQTRVMSIVTAAMDYRKALEKLIDLTYNLHDQVQYGQKTHEDAWSELINHATTRWLLIDPGGSQSIIDREHQYFSQNALRNRIRAEKLAEKRNTPPERRRQVYSNPLDKPMPFMPTIRRDLIEKTARNMPVTPPRDSSLDSSTARAIATELQRQEIERMRNQDSAQGQQEFEFDEIESERAESDALDTAMDHAIEEGSLDEGEPSSGEPS